MAADLMNVLVAVGLLMLAMALIARVRPRRRRGKAKRRGGSLGRSQRLSRRLEPNARERKQRDERRLIRDIEAHERATGESSMALPDPNAHKRKRRA